jgi:hypothetical protein
MEKWFADLFRAVIESNTVSWLSTTRGRCEIRVCQEEAVPAICEDTARRRRIWQDMLQETLALRTSQQKLII